MAQNMKFSIKSDQIRIFLVTFTEEIPNGKIYFLWSALISAINTILYIHFRLAFDAEGY